jgi:hypothetical protein
MTLFVSTLSLRLTDDEFYIPFPNFTEDNIKKFNKLFFQIAKIQAKVLNFDVSKFIN